MPDPEDHVIPFSHLRDCLGWAYLTVAQTGEPLIIQRYNAQDVVLVPCWEWDFLKDMEAAIRAGSCPWEESAEPGQLMLDVPPRLTSDQIRYPPRILGAE